jgi:hypothetical protein
VSTPKPKARERVKDYPDFKDALELAQENQEQLNDWETSFVADLQDKYDKYGDDMFLNENQFFKLMSITENM